MQCSGTRTGVNEQARISTSAAGEGDGGEDGLSAVAEGFSHILKQPNYHLPKDRNTKLSPVFITNQSFLR
jgi:hypothetical protein